MAQNNEKPRIALIVPDLVSDGGLPSVTLFLLRIIEASGMFQADIVSVASSARDPTSVRLLSPPSWFRGVRAVDGVWQGRPYRHFGARLTEFEFQRYRPRRILTRALNEYDLVQVIGGSPAWGLIARDIRPPVLLLAATLSRLERSTRLSKERGLMGLWRRAMTSITERLDLKAIRSASTIYVINLSMLSRLREAGTKSQVLFAPPGVDTELFRPSLNRKGDFILSVARFNDMRKNVRLLFSAYHLLRSRIPDAPRLILAGKHGPTRDDWNVAVSLGIADQVEVREGLPADDLAQLYRNAVLFVLPSDEEGLGIVLLEAMASGTPVVSTRCGGPETVIVHGETGFLTPVGDAQVLATQMQQLLESPQLRRDMGAAGRRTIEARFSLDVAGRAFLDKYTEILSRGGRSCAV